MTLAKKCAQGAFAHSCRYAIYTLIENLTTFERSGVRLVDRIQKVYFFGSRVRRLVEAGMSI